MVPMEDVRSSRGTERGLFRIIWLFCLEWFDSRENETPRIGSGNTGERTRRISGKPRQDGTPLYGGLDLSHSRRIKNFDLTVGANTFLDDGYRPDNYNRRVRVGGNLTYHDPRVQGLNYGVNVNYLYNDYTGFFIWRSPEEPYIQSPLANMGRR